MMMEERIGEAAGKIWQALDKNGPTTKAQLLMTTGLTNNVFHQALGWLAREGKLVDGDGSKREKIGLAG